jgi:WD40 repeat protein
VAILKGHTSTVWSIAFSPDGNYLISASDDLTLRVWKRTQEYKWDCIEVLEGQHERSIYSVSWGVGKSTGKEGQLGWIASAAGDGQIVVWNIAVSRITWRFFVGLTIVIHAGID